MLKLSKLTSCCFTGHRIVPKKELLNVRDSLDAAVSTLIADGITNFITGGATGFDTLAAGVVLKYKGLGHPITLTLALPCEDQSRLWGSHQQSTYEFIRNNADEEVFLEKCYTKDCMRKRNDYMVENSSICISYLRRDRTGTSYTVRKAGECGLEIIPL